MAVLRRDERLEIEETNRETMSMLSSLSADTTKYRCERKRSIRAVVSEIDSPPRVTAATKLLPELRIIPGFELDLATADDDGQLWGFDSKVMRDRALKKIREERPLLLIRFPCVQRSAHGRGSTTKSDIQLQLRPRSDEPYNTSSPVHSSIATS